MYPQEYLHSVENEPEEICIGGSVIVSPQGKIISGPLFGESGALIAELDLEKVIQVKLDFDVNGHYSRKDIFHFRVNEQPEIKKESNQD